MKRFLFTVLLLFTLSTSGFAQGPGGGPPDPINEPYGIIAVDQVLIDGVPSTAYDTSSRILKAEAEALIAVHPDAASPWMFQLEISIYSVDYYPWSPAPITIKNLLVSNYASKVIYPGDSGPLPFEQIRAITPTDYPEIHVEFNLHAIRVEDIVVDSQNFLDNWWQKLDERKIVLKRIVDN